MRRGEERVIAKQVGSGSVREVYVEALAVGELRGYAHPKDHFSASQVSEDDVGPGVLQVQRILYGETRPFSSTVDSAGDIVRDWQHFLAQSDQGTRAHMVVEAKPDAFLGALVQDMPAMSGLGSAAAASAAQAPSGFDDMARNLEGLERGEQEGLEPLIARVLGVEDLASLDPEAVTAVPLHYHCRCSREKFLDKILALPKTDIVALRDGDDPLVVRCEFCNTEYDIEHAALAIAPPT